MHFWKGSAQAPLILTCFSRRESSGHVWERRFKSQHYSVCSSWRVGRSGCGWGAGVNLVARVTRPRQDPRTGTRRGSSGLNAQPRPGLAAFQSRGKPVDLRAATRHAPPHSPLRLLHPRHTQEPPGLHFLSDSLPLPHLLNPLKS